MEALLNALVKPFVLSYEAIPPPWNLLLAILASLLAIFFLFMLRMIPHDRKAIRKRGGKVVFDSNGKPRIVDSGFTVILPWAWDYELVGILDRTFDIDAITVEYSKYAVYRISATVRFSVEHVFKVRYIVEDFVNTLTSASADILRSCILEYQPGEIDSQRNRIEEEFAERIKGRASELGAVFKTLNLTSIEPNMEARKAEAQALMARSQTKIARAIASLGPSGMLMENRGVSLTTENGNHSQ